MRLHRLLSACVGAAALAAGTAHAQTIDQAVIDGLRWRNIGPANMQGRIADVEGIPWPSRTFFVAAAAGGVWKTTNNGTTFRPVFDNYGVASLGDLAIAPSDTNVVYLGTGEPNSRNSISPGGGVFKSTDGGLTWKFVGLKETEHVGSDPGAPHQSERRVGRGARRRLAPEQGAWSLQDHRRWRDLAAQEVHQ
jgi:hypothetical protein